jgi:hypothetical protein
MTGSGKTGLCIALLEEAAIDGVPAIAIDPKGDLGNLKLTFPNLHRRTSSRGWIRAKLRAKDSIRMPSRRQRRRAGRRASPIGNEDGERIQRLRDAVDVEIYTPGSAGRPLSILRSFDAPPPVLRDDATALRERVSSAAAGLLGLLGVDADPLRSREHILLSTLLDQAWRSRHQPRPRGPDPVGAEAAVRQVRRVRPRELLPGQGAPGLAMSINNLLAAPGFATWLEGEALDVQRLLYTRPARPRIAIVSIAHLNDAERMFVVTLLLNEVVAWMRGNRAPRACAPSFYMDEIFGYFPPERNAAVQDRRCSR